MSSRSRNDDSQQCLIIVGNEGLFCKKAFFGDATECTKYRSVSAAIPKYFVGELFR